MGDTRDMDLGIIIILQLLFAFTPSVKSVDHPNVHPGTFCYDQATCDPTTWDGKCKTGKSQSPINIEVPTSRRFSPTTFQMNKHYLSETTHLFYGQNNGHSAQFELNSNTSALMSNLKICGGHLGHCYKFAQLHFHWGETDREGSEHTVNGERFALEMHLVHYRSIYTSLSDALNSPDPEAVAVVAVFFKVGKYNRIMNRITRTLETIQKPGEVKDFYFPLRISDFYPRYKEFAHYKGSLTTPTCNEDVVWTVFLQPQEISEEQINQFRLLSNNEGNSDFNFRPVQNLNGRTVEFYQANGFLEVVDPSDAPLHKPELGLGVPVHSNSVIVVPWIWNPNPWFRDFNRLYSGNYYTVLLVYLYLYCTIIG